LRFGWTPCIGKKKGRGGEKKRERGRGRLGRDLAYPHFLANAKGRKKEEGRKKKKKGEKPGKVSCACLWLSDFFVNVGSLGGEGRKKREKKKGEKRKGVGRKTAINQQSHIFCLFWLQGRGGKRKWGEEKKEGGD